MNEKEIAEIRRRYKPDKNSITHIRGCYVNQQKQIVSEFNQSLGLMPAEEAEKFFSILKKNLSGTVGRNLIDLTFITKQVVDSDEHRLLMSLRSSELKDEEAVHTLFDLITGSLEFETDYLILLTFDTYDVPYRASDGEELEDASSEAYSYILCSVCPIKQTQPALSYFVRENEFKNRTLDWLVSSPELGFVFPAFDDRSTNLYNALYYCRNTEDNHEGFVEALFKCEVPPPAAKQKESFQQVLGGSLGEDCNLEVVQAVHDELCELISTHKASKEAEPLVINKNTLKSVLKSCGVAEENVSLFEENFDAEFGFETTLSPLNLINTKKIEVRTPDVTITVNPERGDLVQTRILGGVKYLLIRADEGVEVNGIPIRIDE